MVACTLMIAALFFCMLPAGAFSPAIRSLGSTFRHSTAFQGARSLTMMPIGVPKVPYKMPGSRGGEWVDIYQRLNRERIIFLGSEIDDEMANQIIGVLLVC
jgi:ATP-dependent Clp protease protease subunit